jgi:hypothetical protein
MGGPVQARPDKTISGMALGWDMAFAQVSADLGIPFIAAGHSTATGRRRELDWLYRANAFSARGCLKMAVCAFRDAV